MTLWDYVKAIFSIGMEKPSDTKMLTMYTSLADRMKDNVSAICLYIIYRKCSINQHIIWFFSIQCDLGCVTNTACIAY